MPEFLDTSVVIRYLTADPPQLAQKAKVLIEGLTQFEITETVILEAAHVLRTMYGVTREDTIDLLIALVKRPNVEVHGLHETPVTVALGMARPSGRVSLGDALIWCVANQCSPSRVYTFDKRFPSAGIDLQKVG
jgi:predicted nucleic acid-binding protein